MKAPSNLDEYFTWAKAHLSVDFADAALERAHRINVGSAVNAVQQSPFYSSLPGCLVNWEEEYRRQTGSDLFMTPPDLRLDQKRFSSMVDKSFRINVLWNKKWPAPPQRGWVTPSNWHTSINDLIRTRLVCKFIDGPEYLSKKITAHAGTLKLEFRAYPQGRDEGYYAYHFYAWLDVDMFIDGQTSTPQTRLELQLTTQLQDVLRQLTHEHYAADRLKPEDDAWKWEYTSDKFRARFLSHTLHMLEGLVVQLRDNSPAKGTKQ